MQIEIITHDIAQTDAEKHVIGLLHVFNYFLRKIIQILNGVGLRITENDGGKILRFVVFVKREIYRFR